MTGIGGNVGQGILKNLDKIPHQIQKIGCNAIEFSAGNHLCDKFYLVPFAYDAAYLSKVKEIIDKESIDLIIPSTDHELYALAKNQELLDNKVAISSFETINRYWDKYFTFKFHKENDLPFAESCLPSEYQSQFDKIIVKPRRGNGSKNIQINPPDLSLFRDDEYMVQQLHEGIEITTPFYVNANNQLHGFINFDRKLYNGTTTIARVNKTWDASITSLLEKIIAKNNFKGAVNLQSIVDKDGVINPFEVNCRVSGTNSIRSNFGFNDVQYTVQERLFNEALAPVVITEGIATRILTDVIYPNQTDFKDILDNKNPFFNF